MVSQEKYPILSNFTKKIIKCLGINQERKTPTIKTLKTLKKLKAMLLTDKCDYMNLKRFCTRKEPVNLVKNSQQNTRKSLPNIHLTGNYYLEFIKKFKNLHTK